MALFGLVFLVVALVLVGIGIAVGLVGCVIASVLLGLGVISSSFLVGLRSRRPAVGFRVFLLQCGFLAGIPAGAVCAWLAQSFFAAYGSGWPIFVYGAVGGATGGLVVALLVDQIARRVHLWASTRLLPTRSNARLAMDREG